ncbi:MAG: hypothetical protein H2174_05010 [Vampirovibrio sp.]|nr:hypothetical protein [Vampirovibrio sp.]
MGGYNMNIGGGYPYNPLINAQQTQNTAPAVSTGIGNFDLNDPTAFLKSIGNKLSAALSPININRNEFRSDINQANLDKLNIKLVDPPPVYNNYPTQGYNAPYPNQGYAQGGGQQLVPVFTQIANGPQIAGYVTAQTPQQTAYGTPYRPNQNYPQNYQSANYGYAGQNNYPANYGNANQTNAQPNFPSMNYGYAGQNNYPQNYQSPNYGYAGQNNYPQNYQSPNYGYAGQNNYPQNYQSPNYGYAGQNNYPQNYQSPNYGYAGQNNYPQNYQSPNYGYADPTTVQPNYPSQGFPPPISPNPFETRRSNSWESWLDSAGVDTIQTQAAGLKEAAIAPLKAQLRSLKSTKNVLKKQLDNDQLSTTEKNALNSQLDDIKQQERQLKAEIRKLGGQSVHKGRPNKTEAPPPPPTEGFLNPIVNSTIKTTTP